MALADGQCCEKKKLGHPPSLLPPRVRGLCICLDNCPRLDFDSAPRTLCQRLKNMTMIKSIKISLVQKKLGIRWIQCHKAVFKSFEVYVKHFRRSFSQCKPRWTHFVANPVQFAPSVENISLENLSLTNLDSPRLMFAVKLGKLARSATQPLAVCTASAEA